MYAYCNNNPVNASDPTGLCSTFTSVANGTSEKRDCYSFLCSQSACYIPLAEALLRLNIICSAIDRRGEKTGPNNCLKFVAAEMEKAGRPIPGYVTNYSGTEVVEELPGLSAAELSVINYSSGAWAKSMQSITGRDGFTFHPEGDGYQPRMGDIIVYPDHVHFISSICSDGTYVTVGASEGGGYVCINGPGADFGTPLGYVTY